MPHLWHCSYCLCLAEGKFLSLHPLVSDFMSVGRRLEELGSAYLKGKVAVVDPEAYLVGTANLAANRSRSSL